MKTIVVFLACASFVQLIYAQSSKQVKWVFKAKKIGDKTYDAHMTATINGNYHLYAQNPGGDGVIATSFTFIKSPLLTLNGPVREDGKLITKFDPTWNHDLNFFEGKVDFVQVVKLKGMAKTNLAGKVEFMVCNNRQCERPSEVDIKVNIGD